VAALLGIVIGGLYAAGLYLALRRSLVKLVLGLALLGHAANLLLFVANGLTRASAPFVPLGASEPIAPFADPVPQALVLTAIVIGFGVQAFALVLLKRAHAATGHDDLDRMADDDLPAVGDNVAGTRK
jgi:multicomponent Na+:H+ antiporter subunit C